MWHPELPVSSHNGLKPAAHASLRPPRVLSFSGDQGRWNLAGKDSNGNSALNLQEHAISHAVDAGGRA
jgi:hypothetical protein